MNLKSIATIDWVCVFYLTGAMLSLFFLHVFPGWLFLLTLVILGALSYNFRKNRLGLSVIFSIFFLFLGLFRTAGSFTTKFPLGTMTLRGYVAEAPVFSQRSQKFPLKTSYGTAFVTTDKYAFPLLYGDVLDVSGDLSKRKNIVEVGFPKILRLPGNEGNFLFAAAYSLRNNFTNILTRILPSPENSLASGLLLGTSGITDKNFIENLRITGTSHIVSVSGFNVSIVIIGVLTLLSFGSTKLSLLPLILIVFLFDLLVGFTPPVLRATFMGLMLFFAKFVGRQRNTTDALLFSAAIITFLDPQSLSSVSFQLSFLATAGIVYFYPLTYRFLSGIHDFFREPLALTLSAQLAVMPIIIYNFGTLSLISPLANLLVGWAIIPLMALTFLTGFFGVIIYPLGQFFGALDLVLLTYFVKIIELLAKIPWASVQL